MLCSPATTTRCRRVDLRTTRDCPRAGATESALWGSRPAGDDHRARERNPRRYAVTSLERPEAFERDRPRPPPTATRSGQLEAGRHEFVAAPAAGTPRAA